MSSNLTLSAKDPSVDPARARHPRSIFDDACARIGLQPRIALEASNLGILARLASLGLGVAILPESVAAATAGLHEIEIINPRMRGKVALAWRIDGPIGPAAQALIRRARVAMAASAGRDRPRAGTRD